MSILIKGMDMPKENNKKLLLLISADGTVDITSFLSSYVQKTDATAVEVPTPHGDLIDREEHKQFLENKIGQCLELQDHIAWLNEQPTVIESEE